MTGIHAGRHAAFREQFTIGAGLTYLDSANYGLPPRATVAALREALDGWATGTADWRPWDTAGEDCRRAFAELGHVAPESVALVPAVSVASGLVASSLAAGSTVLVPDNEFTSVLFPILVAESRGVHVRTAPFDRLADAIDDSTTLVAASWVHSATGAVLDIDAVRAACEASGALLYLDVTQGLGTCPLDFAAAGATFVACAAYKFLLCPRGVAFFYVAPHQMDALPSVAAGWRSAERPYERFYGGPLTLAAGAARYDVSLAWHAWFGARSSLATLLGVDEQVRHELACAPARRLAAHLGLPRPGAAIVSIPIRDPEALTADLRDANIRLSLRAGLARASFHVYNTDDDADTAASVIANHVAH